MATKLTDRTRYHIFNEYDGKEVECTLEDGKSNPFGWSVYEIQYNEKKIAILYCGYLKELADGYRAEQDPDPDEPPLTYTRRRIFCMGCFNHMVWARDFTVPSPIKVWDIIDKYVSMTCRDCGSTIPLKTEDCVKGKYNDFYVTLPIYPETTEDLTHSSTK